MRPAPRHRRFKIAFALGLVAGTAAWALGVAADFALLIGADAFFLIYLALSARIVSRATAEELRRHAEADDEGVALILFLAALAVMVSIAAIFVVLNSGTNGFAVRGMALLGLPLGWATIHVLAAFHYAHLHYHGGGRGLQFSGDQDPDAWDFLYASFTIGMTAQVSDVAVASRPLRRAVLVHGVASFFYNTCILALAINAALTVGH